MSQAHVSNKQAFTLQFNSELSQKMALVIFCKKPSLATALAQKFGLQFDGAVHGKSDTRHVSGIRYWGPAGCDIKLKKALDVLTADFEERKYFSKEAINEIADQINLKGSYVRGQFTAANQNGKKGPTGGNFNPKNDNQKKLAELIAENDFTFALGPAGTGKTHVAMMMAIQALKNKEVSKIILARPAQEAGERLGFLPGDQNEKIAPYMRPLYDELDKAYGNGAFKKMIDNGTIELCPIGFLRGRTLTDAFIVVDEAQNLLRSQIKMVLTRLGEGSKMVITGDQSQIDLASRSMSGLMPAMERLNGKPGIGVMNFDSKDVVRHPTVQVAVEALGDDFDNIPEVAPRRNQGGPSPR